MIYFSVKGERSNLQKNSPLSKFDFFKNGFHNQAKMTNTNFFQTRISFFLLGKKERKGRKFVFACIQIHACSIYSICTYIVSYAEYDNKKKICITSTSFIHESSIFFGSAANTLYNTVCFFYLFRNLQRQKKFLVPFFPARSVKQKKI